MPPENDDVTQNASAQQPEIEVVSSTEQPDAGAGNENDNNQGDPPAAASAENAGQQQERQPEVKPKKGDWAQKRIGELTAARHQADRERQEEAARAANAEARATALERALEAALTGTAPTEGVQPETQVRRQPGQSQEDFQAAVRAEAVRLANAQAEQAKIDDFNTKADKIFDDGVKAYPDHFAKAVGDLRLAGVMTQPVVEAVMDTDAPAAVLNELGKDPDEAMRIAGLPPRKMAVELDRIAQRLAKPAPKPISNAPAPIEPIGAGNPGPLDTLSDSLSDEEWIARRTKQIRARQSA